MSEETKPADDGTEPVTLVYVGTHHNAKKNKLSHMYIIIGEDENDGRELNLFDVYTGDRALWYAKPLTKYAAIGAILAGRGKRDEKGNLKLATFPKPTGGRWQNEDERIEWQARTRTNEDMKNLQSKCGREKYGDLAEPLEKLRTAYRACGHLQRSLILAWMVKEITK